MSKKRGPKPKYTSILTQKFLEKEYVDKQLSLEQIGDNIGCAASVVKRALDKHGIETRNGGRPFIDLTNRVFGEWTVIERGEHINNRIMWVCRCSCGTIKNIDSRNLIRGATIACGAKLRHQGIFAYEEISARYWASVLRGAKARGWEVQVTIEEVWALFLEQERRCPICGEILFFTPDGLGGTASLDRIDSSKGYIPGNVRWVHKDINIMRRKMDDQTFFRIIRKVYKYQRKLTRCKAS
jgi:hypothetical protein